MGAYAIYDAHLDDLPGMLDPENAYVAVLNPDGKLLGFCCFGPDARVPGVEYRADDVLGLGGGLRPELTGQGLGNQQRVSA